MDGTTLRNQWNLPGWALKNARIFGPPTGSCMNFLPSYGCCEHGKNEVIDDQPWNFWDTNSEPSSHILPYVLHRIWLEQGFYMLIPGVLPVLTSLIPKIMAGQPELANVSQQVLAHLSRLGSCTIGNCFSPPKARRFFVEILNGTRRSFIFLHTYACHYIIPHFVDGDSLTSTAWHRGITGHLGLEVADGLEHGCHFSPLLDSHRHADLVAGRTLHATLL